MSFVIRNVISGVGGGGCGHTLTALNLLWWNWSGDGVPSFYPNIVAKSILFSASIVNHHDVCQTLLDLFCNWCLAWVVQGSWLDNDEGKIKYEPRLDQTETADKPPSLHRVMRHESTKNCSSCSIHQLSTKLSDNLLPSLPSSLLRPARPSLAHIFVPKTQTGIC